MLLVLLSLLLLLASCALSYALSADAARSRDAAAYGAVAAALAGLPPAVKVLVTGAPDALALPWPLPLGSFSFTLDPLAAFFLVPLLLLTALAAVYGCDYLGAYAGRKSLGPAYAAFNLLTAALLLVFTAANALIFMLGWELMAAASFLLVLFEHEREQSRRAGFIYLAAGGAGALALLAAFGLLSAGSPSLDFAAFRAPQGGAAAAVFLLGLLGFGLKAGFIPLHVWLPEAHPAAPSHVSAVMSGIMIKAGVYGLLRLLSFLTPWQEWWGWTLLACGAVSAVLGALFALAQHDLKRVLAYSSIENVGIIVMAMGLGVIAVVYGALPLAALAFAGALLHALNHALFKGLLFMGAGAVLHGAGTGELEALGGLARRLPRTAPLFILGSAAACALPPLNGFAGEFLVYLGALKSLSAPGGLAVAGVAAGLCLAAAGALAAAAFSRAAGTALLGEPRTERAARAREAGPLMIFALRALAALCLLSGLGAPLLLLPLGTALASSLGFEFALLAAREAAAPLVAVTALGLLLLALAALALLLRRALLAGRPVREGPTWDCGYAAPTARMQYGASSFAQPLADFFQPVLRKVGHYPVITEYFPGKASFAREAQAVFYNSVYMPAALKLRELAYRFSWLQHGRLQLYIMYIVVTLIALLLWKL